MTKRTKNICVICKKAFWGGTSDSLYCPTCARIKKTDLVVKIRTCKDCGIDFFGGPRARRCPDCEYKAQQETNRKYKRQGAMRPIGSSDKCQWCGKEYTVVSGRQKYCSEKCQHDAVLAWQREHKKEYNKTTVQDVKKQERRKQVKKVCVYCGRVFTCDTSTNLCSDYCKTEQKKLRQCISDIKRGYDRDLKKYEEKREKYRVEVQKNHQDL